MPFELSAADLADRLRTKQLSAPEIAQAFLDRAATVGPKLNCFLKIDPDRTLAQAKRAQELLDRGEGGPLTGVPIAVKDNISTEGLETSCASRMLEGYVPPFDASTVQRLKGAGMPILGKLNMDEFAMGASNETSAFGPVLNPWDLSRSPGGSSGGSAAATAARLTPFALGSDTGGSIRQPAALCGLAGFKPTYGRCSRYGLVAFGSSLDQIGPLARSVEDAALLASVVTGHDRRDCSSLDLPPISTTELKNGSLKGLKIGVIKETVGEGISAGVNEVFAQAISRLQAEGAIVSEVSIPSISYGVTTYYIIAPAEASSNLARFDGIRYGYRAESTGGHIELVEKTRAKGFGHEVKTRIMIGTYALSAGYFDAYYVRAQTVRAMMTQEMEAAFGDIDLLVSPTSPVTAFPLGSLINDPLAMKKLDFCTIPANMSGMPAISVHCGLSEGLPVGLHLCRPRGEDESLLQMAHACERSLPRVEAWPEV